MRLRIRYHRLHGQRRVRGRRGAGAFRERLAQRDIKLMLDFVPNHTAPDHPWVKSNPDYYVQGSEEQIGCAPKNYLRVETDFWAANPGAWTRPQLSRLARHAAAQLRQSSAAEVANRQLIGIAGRCDGVRCDMAMLVLPEVFQRTWGVTPEPFWPKTMAAVRCAHPAFTFMAEVYWDLEWTLQQQGFDYCYDKRLYDRLQSSDVRSIREHLRAGLDYQDKLARFLENHDEPRAALTSNG